MAACLCEGNFASQRELVDHWRALVRGRCEKKVVGASPEPLSCTPCRRRVNDPDVVYVPTPGQRYAVSLATPRDADAIVALEDEFVRMHRSIFDDYQDASDQDWYYYMGLRTRSVTKRRQVVADSARKFAAGSDDSSLRGRHHGWYSSDCVLKCELLPLPTVGGNGGGGASSGSSACAKRLSRKTTEPAAAAESTTGAQRKVVGFVQFTLRDGRPADAPRCSQRLKRKRGETGGEYVKVQHLLVTEEHRKRGLGALLLTAVLRRVRCHVPVHAEELFLTVVERNAQAIRLYRRLGFRFLGKNITHLGKGTSRPIAWFQLGINREDAVAFPDDEDDGDVSTTASTVSISNRGQR
eukprot:TRINITY_DN12961_c0_g2_i1.p1 TRINITY_DN12961_c0_g2~~TRINITY_DN12961_c0_g2_i1.p1  ORF type:complete len:353 (-),score=77.45 TRINITY_DN12961_c0_g2_i1:58-1116(-)